MAKLLDVYLYEKIVGKLQQDNDGQLLFTYSEHWLNAPDAVPLSCSLPLQNQSLTERSVVLSLQEYYLKLISVN